MNPTSSKKVQIQCRSIDTKIDFTGLTLKQYFQQTQRLHQLVKIDEEESQQELQYRQRPKPKDKRHLHSLTKLKEYEFDLYKTLGKSKLEKRGSPVKKYSFNNQNGEGSRLPLIHKKSFSPQLKNIKQDILQKFRQGNRVKTEMSEGYSSKPLKPKKEIVQVQATKKQLSTKSKPKVLVKQKREVLDGFLLTFHKTRGNKSSEVYNVSSTRNYKPV